MAYITVQQLVDAMGAPAYMAVFDDGNTGSRAIVDASSPVALVISTAHAEVTSWLPAIYGDSAAQMPAEQPSPVSMLLVSAELQYALCFAYRRHPEYCKTYGAEPRGTMWAECTERMRRIQAAEQRIAPNDNPPAAKPLTVGGFTHVSGQPLICDSPDGTSNAGDY